MESQRETGNNNRGGEPGAFKVILGEERLNRHNKLLTTALYGEPLFKRITPGQMEELTALSNEVQNFVREHYTNTIAEGDETYLVGQDNQGNPLPRVPVSRWRMYLEHIGRIQRVLVE
ncbi:MAG: hypothetical protein WC533_02470 [Candidatus Pacearchaeota archaeon]